MELVGNLAWPIWRIWSPLWVPHLLWLMRTRASKGMKSIESRWGRILVWTRLGTWSPIQSCQMLFQNQRVRGQNLGRSLVPKPEPPEPRSYYLECLFLLRSQFGLVWSQEEGILGSFWLKFWQGSCICFPKVWLGANSPILSGFLTLKSRWSCPCWCIPRSIPVLAWPWRLVVVWGLLHSHILKEFCWDSIMP